MSETELAAALASGFDGSPAVQQPDASTDRDEERRRHLVRLHHVHLPKLAEADVIVWNRPERTARAAERSTAAFESRTDRSAADADPDREVSDPQRRAILAIIGETATPVSRDHLARKLAATEHDSQSAAAIERCTIRLHHCHLPKLEEAGLIHYDTDEGTVTCCGSSTVAGSQPAE